MMLLTILVLLVSTKLVLCQISDDCTAFITDGLAANTFQYHRFYDFRHINTGFRGLPESRNRTRSKIVTDTSWEDDWYIRDYPRASSGGEVLPVDFTPKRVQISQNLDEKSDYTSYLTLSTERIDNETQEAGEITFQEYEVSYASIRIYGRVLGAPGAVAGIFTYLNDTEESDIEMFTRAPTQFLQYSNEPTSSGSPNWIPIPGSTVNATLPRGNRYSDWHVHRLDWSMDICVFFVDDVQAYTTRLQVPIAVPPSKVYIDMWSSASTWSGSMDVGQSAHFDIQWIELLFNTTAELPASENLKTCAVKRSRGAFPRRLSWLGWLPLISMFLTGCW